MKLKAWLLLFTASFFLSSCYVLDINQPWTDTEIAPDNLLQCNSADSARRVSAWEGYEMWYWYMESEQGQIINLNLVHGRVHALLNSSPTLLARFRSSSGLDKIARIKVPYNRFEASERILDITMDGNHFQETEDGHVIEIENSEFSAHLKLTATVRGQKPPSDLDRIEFGDDKILIWRPPIMQARVSGWIDTGDGPVAFDGHGYFDHFWSNVPVAEMFTWHYWAKLHNDEYTIVVGDTIPGRRYGRKRFGAIEIYRDGDLVLATERFIIQEERPDPTGPCKAVLITFDSPECRGEIRGEIPDWKLDPTYHHLGWYVRLTDMPIYDYHSNMHMKVDLRGETLEGDLKGYHQIFPCTHDPTDFYVSDLPVR